ncbi:hypothetical protein WDU94_012551 [Cyamophila willieti]
MKTLMLVSLFVSCALAESQQEFSTDEDDQYSSIPYSVPQSAAKVAPYPAAKPVYSAPSYSYGTPAPVATAAPAAVAYAAPGAYASGGPAPGAYAPGGSAPGIIGGAGPGPSASGPGPSGPGPSASGPGPSGPGPFGPGPSGPGPFGPGPFGFGPGPFFPYPYGANPLAYKYGLKKGLIAFLLTKFKIGFKYLEALIAPIGTITTLMNVVSFLKAKVVPKVAHHIHELQTVQPHDVAAEVITAARRYRRSMQDLDLDSLTQRVLSAIDKNMCTEKLVCQIGKKASQMVPFDSNWMNSTLTMLKKVESPNSLISTFRQAVSNVITDCDVIYCKKIPSSSEPQGVKESSRANELNQYSVKESPRTTDFNQDSVNNSLRTNELEQDPGKTLLAEYEEIEDGSGEEDDEETSQ